MDFNPESLTLISTIERKEGQIPVIQNQAYECQETIREGRGGGLSKHDDTLLRLEIQSLTKNIGYLEAFGKAGKALKMPEAE
jgi:hypothetical protein